MTESFGTYLTYFAWAVLGFMAAIMLYSVGASIHQIIHKRRLRKARRVPIQFMGLDS